MPIKVACKCGQSFAAPDNLAGKTVKCPKCSAPLSIPTAGAAPAASSATRPATPANRPATSRPAGAPAKPAAPVGGLGDLFDEVGITAYAGARCWKCQSPLAPGATMCTKCGFTIATGTHAETSVKSGPKAVGHGDAAEDLLHRAEKEIANSPMAKVTVDQGTWRSVGTWVLVIFIPIILALAITVVVGWGAALYALGVFAGNVIEVEKYGFLIPILLLIAAVLCMLLSWWGVTSTALDHHILHGVAALLTPGSYSVIYGIAHYRTCKHPTDLFLIGMCLYFAAMASIFSVMAFYLDYPWLALPPILLGVGACLTQWGSTRVITEAFEESNYEGYMSLFCPFYFIYYGSSRWKKCKPQMIQFIAGFVLTMVFILVIYILLGAFSIGLIELQNTIPKPPPPDPSAIQ